MYLYSINLDLCSSNYHIWVIDVRYYNKDSYCTTSHQPSTLSVGVHPVLITVCPQQTVLLKADTGADMNLMNRQTFDQLFGKAKYVLQLTPIRMENYGNTAVRVLGMFHAFLRWKDKVYKQLFYITDCDRLPNLLSRDACYTLGVLKPCYTVENSTDSTLSQATPIHASNRDDFPTKSFLHQKMNGTEKKLSNNSNKCSISKGQLQGSPLKKQDILETYADVFTGIGKFPGLPYKFQLKPNAKPARHAPRKVPIHLQDTFHEEIRNLEALGILEETKDVTEWVNSFVIVEKKLPINSNNSHSPGHSMNKKLWICLDPGDLNEALERMLHFHISILKVPPLCKLMHPRKDLVLYFYKIPNQSCLHQGHWLEVRGITKTWRGSAKWQSGGWRNSITFYIEKNSLWRLTRSH